MQAARRDRAASRNVPRHVAGRIPVNRLRQAFQRDAATIMHNINHIEDLRDEGSVFDTELTKLEAEFFNLGK